jgi:hypothetical protein
MLIARKITVECLRLDSQIIPLGRPYSDKNKEGLVRDLNPGPLAP